MQLVIGLGKLEFDEIEVEEAYLAGRDVLMVLNWVG